MNNFFLKLPLELIEYILLQDGSCDKFPVTIFQIIRTFNKRLYEYTKLNLQRFLGYYVKLGGKNGCHNWELFVYPPDINASHLTFYHEFDEFKGVQTYNIRKNRYPSRIALNYPSNTLDIHVFKNNTYSLSEVISFFNITFNRYYVKNGILFHIPIYIIYRIYNSTDSTIFGDKIIIRIETIRYDNQNEVYFKYDEENNVYFNNFCDENEISECISMKDWNEFLKCGYVLQDMNYHIGGEIVDTYKTSMLKYQEKYVNAVLRVYKKYKNIRDFINIIFE